VLAQARDYPCLERARAKIAAFVDLIESCAELAQQMPLDAFYDELLNRTGYLTMLESKNDIENRTRAENVRELKSSIVGYMENAESPTLAGFLEEIALYTDIEQYDADADAVVMMTIHSAKGLEFPNVMLVGMEDGLFPSQREGSQEELEEERRLCYVAITRAKETLAITYARQRMLYGRTSYNRPSRFLYELPEDCVSEKPQPRQRSTSLYGERSGAVPDYAQYGDTQWYPAGQTKVAKPSVHKESSTKSAVGTLFAKGDMVQHTAFGAGLVLSVLPMGNDAMLEIAFDNVGTKRLMAKAASAHMEKKS
jgi:DNA helicase-2/ATP-dependent DNA helicase PcrA